MVLFQKHSIVDCTKVGNSILKKDRIEENSIIFIKERISPSGKSYKAITSGIVDQGDVYLEYYYSCEGLNRIWICLVSLELIKDEEICNKNWWRG